jgi:diguanylate cyclase (GGDEF)-like protein
MMAHPLGDRNRLVIALADADNFKAINDRHGHAVGDLVLVEMAQIMKESLRLHDTVFRYGGEEFLLVLTDATDAAGLEVCSRIRARIEAFNWRSLGRDLRVTVSLGVATRHAGDSLTALMERADSALYQAKNAGRNRVVRG